MTLTEARTLAARVLRDLAAIPMTDPQPLSQRLRERVQYWQREVVGYRLQERSTIVELLKDVEAALDSAQVKETDLRQLATFVLVADVDELAERWIGRLRVQPHDVLQVLVPRPGTDAAHRIARGSGIVGRAGLSPTVTVDFEGNIYHAENLRTFAQRVQHAADRLLQHYPTVARSTFARHAFDVVGTVVDGDVHITDDARVDDWCRR